MPQERILIIDGDITLAEMLTTRLKNLGYLVDCVHRGNEALDILRAQWVDLIILDIILQGDMHGFQLFKEIKKKKVYNKIPIVVHSSRPGMKKMFEQLGVAKYFVKPYHIDKFLVKVEELLSR